jgi:hypothetical protein
MTLGVPSLSACLHAGYERVPVRLHVPNPMRCYRCQTQQRCASHFVCGQCAEGRHRQEPRPSPPHCVNCFGAHVSADRKCPIFLEERAIQELRDNDGLSFMDARKKFLAHQPKIGTQSFATAVRRPRGVVAATQTSALVKRGVASVAPRTTVPSQSEACIQTEDLPTSTVPGVKLRACHTPALDIRQLQNSTKPPATKP